MSIQKTPASPPDTSKIYLLVFMCLVMVVLVVFGAMQYCQLRALNKLEKNLSGLAKGQYIVNSGPATQNYKLYMQAVQQTRFPTRQMIDSNLFPLKPEDKNVIVVTFKTPGIGLHFKNNAKGFYDTDTFEIWVTAQQELNHRIMGELNLKQGDDTILRLQQLLGLPPVIESRGFVVMSVPYDSLVRPCPDAETNDCNCDLGYTSKTDPAWVNWYNKQVFEKRFSSTDPLFDYPFTGLGYTYDWSPDNHNRHIGLSEYVIKKNTHVKVVRQFTSIADYFAKAH